MHVKKHQVTSVHTLPPQHAPQGRCLCPLRQQIWQQAKFGNVAQQCSLVETPNGSDKRLRTWQADGFTVADIPHTMTALCAYVTQTVIAPTNQSQHIYISKATNCGNRLQTCNQWMSPGESGIQSHCASEQGNDARASTSFDHTLATHRLLFTVRILKCALSAMRAPSAAALRCTGYDMATQLQCWGTEGALLRHIASSLFISQSTFGLFDRHEKERTRRSVSDNCMYSRWRASHKTIKTSSQWQLWFSFRTL